MATSPVPQTGPATASAGSTCGPKRASRSVGTATPTSRQALCKAAAMTDVESINVPSQSKITRS